MGEAALFVLAIAGSASFGVAGVLLGVFLGARSVQRDESRYAQVIEAYDTVAKVTQSIRGEWATAQENLEQLLEAVETRRRRIAASDSAEKRKANGGLPVEAPVALTAAQERDSVRQGIGG